MGVLPCLLYCSPKFASHPPPPQPPPPPPDSPAPLHTQNHLSVKSMLVAKGGAAPVDACLLKGRQFLTSSLASAVCIKKRNHFILSVCETDLVKSTHREKWAISRSIADNTDVYRINTNAASLRRAVVNKSHLCTSSFLAPRLQEPGPSVFPSGPAIHTPLNTAKQGLLWNYTEWRLSNKRLLLLLFLFSLLWQVT